jgi:hypothetical protein
MDICNQIKLSKPFNLFTLDKRKQLRLKYNFIKFIHTTLFFLRLWKLTESFSVIKAEELGTLNKKYILKLLKTKII